jgi:hypothetical protein
MFSNLLSRIFLYSPALKAFFGFLSDRYLHSRGLFDVGYMTDARPTDPKRELDKRICRQRGQPFLGLKKHQKKNDIIEV